MGWFDWIPGLGNRTPSGPTQEDLTNEASAALRGLRGTVGLLKPSDTTLIHAEVQESWDGSFSLLLRANDRTNSLTFLAGKATTVNMEETRRIVEAGEVVFVPGLSMHVVSGPLPRKVEKISKIAFSDVKNSTLKGPSSTA